MNNKHTWALVFTALITGTATAQDRHRPPSPVPLTLFVVTESVGLPALGGLLRGPGVGFRVGTEFCYRRRPGSQLIQTLNVGGYHHARLHNGLYLNTEFGYRKFAGRFFAEGFIGVGALGLAPLMRSYLPTGDGDFRAAPAGLVRVMPSLSAGLGYAIHDRRARPVSVFVRYETFGEAPFSNRGVPVLPHTALHLGLRLLTR